MNSLDYAKAGAKTLMDKFKPEELPPTHRFHYHQGVFLTGVERIYELTGDKKYRDYIRAWVDFNVDKDGNAPNCFLTEFDDMQPGMLLFNLYKETGEERYKILLDKIADSIESYPTNAKGGVWHKNFMKNQMWLDSMYMMGVVSSMYAKYCDRPYLFEKVYTQMALMRDYMTDENTGLMYHVWDDSKQCEFTDNESGLSSTFWGRAIGWYAAGVAEILEYLPENHPKRDEFIQAEINLLNAVKKFQDKETGLWYQVVDKTDDKRNWLETSCSALFVYAAAKSYRLGIIDDSFKDMILEGYRGVLSKTNLDGEHLNVTGVCIGTGVGTLEQYFERPTVENDLHGMGAFLLMSTEIYKAFKE